MEISDYLADWALELRAVAARQIDDGTKRKLLELADECHRITRLVVVPEGMPERLN